MFASIRLYVSPHTRFAVCRWYINFFACLRDRKSIKASMESKRLQLATKNGSSQIMNDQKPDKLGHTSVSIIHDGDDEQRVERGKMAVRPLFSSITRSKSISGVNISANSMETEDTEMNSTYQFFNPVRCLNETNENDSNQNIPIIRSNSIDQQNTGGHSISPVIINHIVQSTSKHTTLANSDALLSDFTTPSQLNEKNNDFSDIDNKYIAVSNKLENFRLPFQHSSCKRSFKKTNKCTPLTFYTDSSVDETCTHYNPRRNSYAAAISNSDDFVVSLPSRRHSECDKCMLRITDWQIKIDKKP